MNEYKTWKKKKKILKKWFINLHPPKKVESINQQVRVMINDVYLKIIKVYQKISRPADIYERNYKGFKYHKTDLIC